MIGIGISPLFKRGGGGVSYGPYTIAFNTQVLANGGSLTPSELSALTTFETSMGSDMAEFDRLWIHGLSNQIAARTSFVNPTSTAITEVNSPTWTAYQGFTGNGSTTYLDTNYNPSTSGVKYTLNNACLGVYSRITAENCAIGALDIIGGNKISRIYPKYGSFILYTNNQAGDSYASWTTYQEIGLLSAVRLSSNSVKYYRNGSQLASDTTASSGLPNLNIYLLSQNYNGLILQSGAYNIAMSHIGSGNINQSNFYNASQTLGTTLGWAV